MNEIQKEPFEDGLKVVLKRDPSDPAGLAAELCSLAKVRRLSLMQPISELKDISFLANITSLEDIHLNSLPKGADVSILARLPRLISITTGDRCWFDCSVLPSIPNLETFRSGPHALAFESVKDCRKLRWLELRGIRSGDCSFVAGLPTLARLRLWDCRISRSTGLGDCPQLRDVDLGRSSITSLEGLAGACNLEKLALSHCVKINNSESIMGCASLQLLDVDHCRFEITAEMIDSLPELQVFSALNANLSDTACAALLRKATLRKLSVDKKYKSTFLPIASQIDLHVY